MRRTLNIDLFTAWIRAASPATAQAIAVHCQKKAASCGIDISGGEPLPLPREASTPSMNLRSMYDWIDSVDPADEKQVALLASVRATVQLPLNELTALSGDAVEPAAEEVAEVISTEAPADAGSFETETDSEGDAGAETPAAEHTSPAKSLDDLARGIL